MAVVATGLAQSFTISGRVTDATTGEYILGANVVNVKEGKGMGTNAYGFFSMTLPAGSATLSCSFIGYETATKTFAGNQDEDWNVALAPQAIAVDAAEVVGTAGQNTQSTDLGKAEVATRVRTTFQVPRRSSNGNPALCKATTVTSCPAPAKLSEILSTRLSRVKSLRTTLAILMIRGASRR